MSTTVLFQAPLLLCDADRLVEAGGLLVQGGRVARVLASPSACRRAVRAGARRVELDDCVLAPGLVNAHAHLDLTGLAGALPRSGGFVRWVGELLRRRSARRPRQLAADAARGAARCVETGTTAVGDVDSTGAWAGPAAAPAPRTVLYREVLDAWDPSRTAGALDGVRRALPRRARRAEGVSPHAPFTTSAALLAGVRSLRRRRRLPATVHWAETREEIDWLERGRGPLAAVLPPSPRRRGLDLLAEAGLLDRRTSLVHGNLPARGEPARIARAGCTLVHCPGTHAFFGREPFPWRRYLRAGVPIALGTDSLASNDDLDLRREMALARAAAPWLSPERVFAMATTGGARALGFARELGRLARGTCADFVAFRVAGRRRRPILEELTGGGGSVVGVWVDGRAVIRFPARSAVN